MGKGERGKVAALFFTAVFVYGIAASFFTSTVHIGVDEELYLALAKSFHDSGRFVQEGRLANYSCVLYSVLISAAYFFYSPDRILFLMRMMGVIMMSSAAFPIYLLAREVLGDKKLALRMSCFLMIMPYMFDSAYIMQETLSYPLFLWAVYFLCLAFDRDSRERHALFLVCGSVFSALCVSAKTYLFFIPVAVNLCFLSDVLRKKSGKRQFLDILLYDMVYAILFVCVMFFPYAINGFERGNNHYAGQFSQLFPLSVSTILSGAMGCVVYAAFFVVNTGVFPMGALISRWKEEKSEGGGAEGMAASLFADIDCSFDFRSCIYDISDRGRGRNAAP